jgi:hypothetical protein
MSDTSTQSVVRWGSAAITQELVDVGSLVTITTLELLLRIASECMTTIVSMRGIEE